MDSESYQDFYSAVDLFFIGEQVRKKIRKAKQLRHFEQFEQILFSSLVYSSDDIEEKPLKKKKFIFPDNKFVEEQVADFIQEQRTSPTNPVYIRYYVENSEEGSVLYVGVAVFERYSKKCVEKEI